MTLRGGTRAHRGETSIWQLHFAQLERIRANHSRSGSASREVRVNDFRSWSARLEIRVVHSRSGSSLRQIQMIRGPRIKKRGRVGEMRASTS